MLADPRPDRRPRFLLRSPLRAAEVSGVPAVESPSPSAQARPPARGRIARRSRSGPQPYDFRRPTALAREHVRSLQIAHETLARRWATLLTSSLRAVSSVTLASIEQLTYDEYVASLSTPTVMSLLSLGPVPGAGVLEVSLPTAMVTIDHLLGGPGGLTQPERSLTEIETQLLRGVLDRVLGELRYAFESLVPMTPAIVGIEYNPQFAQAAAASDMVVVATFEVRIGAVESVATICLPFAGLLARLDVARGQGFVSERDREAQRAAAVAVASRLEVVPLDVAVRFDPVPVTPEQLVGLQVGDVLTLRHRTSAPLRVVAADVTFAHAVPGSHGRRLGCLVVESPEAADDTAVGTPGRRSAARGAARRGPAHPGSAPATSALPEESELPEEEASA